MYTSFHNTKTRKFILYNLKTHKVFLYVTTVLVLALALRRLCGAGAGAVAGACGVPRHLWHPGDTAPPADAPLSPARAATLRARLARLNDNCTELGGRGDRAQGDTIVVVQVHRDPVRLRYLIASLARVQGIEDIVLVFSHGHQDERMDELVRGVSFCRVVQIYFPHSAQLNPGAFAGVEGGDATRAQHKQHWWWKAHFVFSRVERPGSTVLLLEEHDYVAPDALHVLHYARLALAAHPAALVVALGRVHGGGGGDYGLLALEEWQPLYGVGLALNRTAWRRIVARTDRFCLFDDSGWSYSLLNVFGAETDGAAAAVVAVAPRVVVQNGRGGGAGAGAGWFPSADWFPGEVRCVSVWGAAGRVREAPRAPRGAGGWADARDRQLCLDPLLSSATEAATDGEVTVTEHVVS